MREWKGCHGRVPDAGLAPSALSNPIAADLFRLVRGYSILRLATSARRTWCTSVSRIWSECARRMAEMPGRFSSKTAATSFGICFPITAYMKYWAEWPMMSSRRSRCARNSRSALASRTSPVALSIGVAHFDPRKPHPIDELLAAAKREMDQTSGESGAGLPVSRFGPRALSAHRV